MKRRSFIPLLCVPAAYSQQRSDPGKYYFEALRDIHPLRTGVKSMSRKELQFPKVGEFQVVTGDFHVHTLYSDGTVMPAVRLYEAWTEGVDVVALTDHSQYLRQVLPQRSGRSFGEVEALAKAMNLVLIRGAEVSTVYTTEQERMSDVVARQNTDFIVLFVQDENALFAPFEVAMQRAREQNCINIWAHPGRDWRPLPQKFLDMGWLHGIEIRNTVTSARADTDEFRGSFFYPHVAGWAKDKKLAIIASSDAHTPAQYERPTNRQRDYTLLLVKERTAEGVREAILARRTFAWFDDLLWGSEENLTALVGASIHVESMSMDGALRGFCVRNRCSIPFEVRFLPEQGPGLPLRPSSLPPMGSVICPVPATTMKPPGEVTLRLTNVFTDRRSNLELKRPVS